MTIKFNAKPMSAAEAKIQQYIVDNVKPHELESVHMISDCRALVCLRDGSCFHLIHTPRALIRIYIDEEI